MDHKRKYMHHIRVFECDAYIESKGPTGQAPWGDILSLGVGRCPSPKDPQTQSISKQAKGG